MSVMKDVVLLESEKASKREVQYAIDCVNKAYKEWKKVKRRTNSANIITTSINLLAPLDANVIPRVHEATRLKMATILMRCLDVPYWKSPSAAKKPYERLIHLIQGLKNYNPKSGTGGKLKEVIYTRLSACVGYSQKSPVFVAYEPKVPSSYLRYLFGSELPNRTYLMTPISLPEKYEDFLDILQINIEKAKKAYRRECNANKS